MVAKSLVVNSAGQLLMLEQGAEGVSRIDLTAASQAALQCVAGAASRVVGAGLSPGKIVTLLGRGIGPKAGRSAELTGDLRFPLSLDGVQVKVNGVASPLLYVQDSQINAIVPFEGVTPRSAAKVEVEYEGKTLSVETPSAFTGVELFTNDFSGRGQAVAVHENGSLNSPDNAIAAGSIIVLYGTGIGVTSPASTTGALAPISGAGALAQPIGPVVAFIGGRQAEVLYAGAAPGLVNGAAQFNVRVPIGVSGNVNVDIRINGSLPGNLATIAVR